MAQEGQAALGRLYDLTAQRLLRFAWLITRHRDDAEDALQSALLRVAARPALVAQADHPWAYLVRIVRNESLTLLRKQQRQARQAVADDIPIWEQPLCEQQDKSLLVQRAIAALPCDQAEVIVLKIWEEMTFHEIAEVLEQSQNTVASRYRYALQKLAMSLEPHRHEVQP